MRTFPNRVRSPDRATQYALDVLCGSIVAGPHVRDAAQRHLDDLGRTRDDPDWKYYYDEEAAAKDIGFFEDCLCLNGGQFEGKPFILFPWETFVIGSLFGWKRKDNDKRRFRVAFVETGKGPLALDTLIATPSGWTTMGELGIGDYVFDDQGNPTKVIDTSPVFYNRDCYEVEFSDGDKIVADAEHRWLVSSLRSFHKPGPHNGPKKGGYSVRTTHYISKTYSLPESKSKHPQAKWNHRVDVAPPLKLPDADLPVAPYTLGLWLGDGDSDAARITSADDEVLDYVRVDGYIIGEKGLKDCNGTFRVSIGLSDPTTCNRGHSKEPGQRCHICDHVVELARKNNRPIPFFKGNSLSTSLRVFGLIKNKHIPEVYFRASASQRLSLLQGLMDSDGHIGENGKCEITLCNKRLSYNVADLLRTLGYKCVVNEGPAMLRGVEVGRRWRIGFQAYWSQPPARLKRKLLNLSIEPNTRPLSRGRMIVGCKEVESVPVRCITVEAESHLFLAGKYLIPLANSGKSPLCAGVGIKGLVADGEERAEIYAAATLKDQAMVLFRDACAFYDQSELLRERLIPSGVGERRWNLAYPKTNSFFRVIASDTQKGKSGPRPHMALLDEIHEHANGDVIELLRAGFKFRIQPLSFMITNSGHDMTSVCREYHDLGARVSAQAPGSENEEFFAFVCSLDDEDFKDAEGEDDDHYLYDESLWPKVNPSLPYGIPGYDYIRTLVKEAEGLPSKMSTVKRLNFCVWTESENPAIGKNVWMACQDKDYPDELLKGRKCWGGLDLAAVKDLTAFALLFEPGSISMEKIDGVWQPGPPTYDPYWRIKIWFWMPGIGLVKKADNDHVTYIAWRDAGYINAIDRKTVAYEFVAHDIKKICDKFDPELLAFDRWSKDRFDVEVDRLGIKLPEMVEFGQGYQSMGPAVKIFETKLVEGQFRHQGNPCLTWNAANVVAVEDPTLAKKYDKKKSTGRIDGIIAIVMACGILQDQGAKRNIYNDMDLITS